MSLQDQGKFQLMTVDSKVTTSFLIRRVIANWFEFEERNKKKEAKEIKVQAAEAKRRASDASEAAT